MENDIYTKKAVAEIPLRTVARKARFTKLQTLLFLMTIVSSTSLSVLSLSGCQDTPPDSSPSPDPTSPAEEQPRWDPVTSAINFGSVAVGETGAGVLEFQNTGGTTLTVSLSLPDDGNGAFSLDSVSSFDVPSGSTVVADLSFSPLEPGEAAGVLHVSTNDESSSEVDVALQGSGFIPDSDEDGSPDDVDCRPDDPLSFPGANEVCDGFDNNCDGSLDEGVQLTLFRDADDDGYGDASDSQTACALEEGYVANADDCDDHNPAISPDGVEVCNGLDDDCNAEIDDSVSEAPLWYRDTDLDGYGVEDATVSDCEQPEGFASVAGDCNDGDAAYHPGAAEADCTDPNDYNCDGSTGFADADLDGTPACQDCNDQNAQMAPGKTEVCDGMDNNCDGAIDEALTITLYVDADGDQYGDAFQPVQSCSSQLAGHSDNALDCDDTNPAIFPGASETCNNLDDDCDTQVDEDAIDVKTWYSDGDSDGYGVDGTGTTACVSPTGYAPAAGDCNDSDPAYNPGANESNCADPNDYNCDGSVAYSDVDGDGFPACQECDDTNADTHPGATEVCDAIDNDCDGSVDEQVTSTWYQDADGDGYGNASAPYVGCDKPEAYVSDATDCNDKAVDVNPGATEACNGKDDDCDLSVDEVDATGCILTYSDGDGDTWGSGASTCACSIPTGSVTRNGDCNDKDAQVNPGAQEKCSTSYDDDCDGSSNDENAQGCTRFYNDQDVDGWGNTTDYSCLCTGSGSYQSTTSGDCNDKDNSMYPGNPEVCDEKDNNCSGQIDEGVKTTWYVDSDGDGWGATYNTKEACTQPTGYVSKGGDCNDYNADINPGEAELCDALDNNCNGQSDEGITTVTVYIDLDGDGYGAKGTTGKKACLTDADGDGQYDDPPVGYSLVATDCDDSASTVYPTAPELCDGRLNDCTLTVADYQCPQKCAGAWPVFIGGSSGYPAVAQLDSDNEFEVVIQAEGTVRALEHDGTQKWATALSVSYSYPNLADMNYDNTLDVLVGVHGGNHVILNGSTGATLATLSNGSSAGYYNSIAFDVDGDGATDIVPAGYSPYKLMLMNKNLTVKSTVSLNPISGESFILSSPALYDYEGDGIAEILAGSGSWQCSGTPSSCKGRQYIFKADGTYWNDPTWTNSTKPWFDVDDYPYTYSGEGVWNIVADADGDGVEETSQYFTNKAGGPSKSWIWNDDGTEHALSGSAWNSTFPILAPVGSDYKLSTTGLLRNMGGPTVDIDKDGTYEVVTSNSNGLVVLKKGQVMDGYPVKLSPERRIIADINRDGRLDMLFVSSSNNSLNCYTMGEGTWDDSKVLSYGTLDGLGRNWYTTGHMDPYEPNDKRTQVFNPAVSTNPVADSRAFYLGPLRDTFASGNGWYRRIRGLISEKADRDYYVMYGGIINLSLTTMSKDFDLYLHQYHPNGTYIDTLQSTNTGTAAEAITCHTTTNCAYTSESKILIIEVRPKDPTKDYGPYPYSLSAIWAN